MPLPASNAPWAPFDKDTTQRFREYDAWYSGVPERLGKAYNRAKQLPTNHPSQYRGGMVGAIARMFWGAPIPAGETRSKIHVPLPADVATASSDLLFGKQPRIQFAKTATQKRWDELARLTKLRSRLPEAAEVQSAFGGVFMRVGYDTDVARHPLVNTVHADRAIATFVWGRLAAVTFFTTLENDGGKVVRYLQRYEMDSGQAVELNGVYVGTEDNLGDEKPLTYHSTTKDLEPFVPDGLPVLPVVHVPNMLPSREDRSNELGRSDFEGITQQFDQVDETMTSWMRDIRLAKARIITPSAYLQSLGPGQGASFDLDREVYEAIEAPPNTTLGLTLQQFAIRVDEHDRSMMRFVRQAVGTAGYSASTFGLEEQGGGGEQTATEVNDRRNRSLLTREKKAGYWTDALQELSLAVRAVDNLIFGSGVDLTELATVQWPDGAAMDPLKLAQTVQAWDVARAASTEVKVRALHPDWTDGEVMAEVERIKGEDIVEDPGTFRGDAGPPADAEESPEDEPEE